MTNTTLILLLKNQAVQEILLGYKKIGFGQGKFTGFGGKIKTGEEVIQATIREFEEETGIHLCTKSLTFVAILKFHFPNKPSWTQCVYVFTSIDPGFTPQESREMIPIWFPYQEVPYEQMWDDARYWLPRILEGETFQAQFTFQTDNETVINAIFSPLFL